jgi:nitroreductase
MLSILYLFLFERKGSLMELFEAINKRHSYRGQFKSTPVGREDLKKIVQAGMQAPSGCNRQTTDFVIVDEPALVSQIAPMHTASKAFQSAHAFIAAVVDINPEPAFEGMSFVVEDCAAAVENILLAITAMGYAAVWIDGWLRVEQRAQKIGHILGLPEGKIVRVILPIGVPEEQWPPKEKKPFDQRAWFNKYGQ